MSSSAHFDTRYWCYQFLFSHWKNILSTKVLLWRVICQNCAHPAERSSYTKQPRLNRVHMVVEFCYTFTCILFSQKDYAKFMYVVLLSGTVFIYSTNINSPTYAYHKIKSGKRVKWEMGALSHRSWTTASGQKCLFATLRYVA